LQERRERIGGNLSISYKRPLKIVRGWQQYLYDSNGQAYIDAYNNVAHVGHCHPRVVQAATAQYGLLSTNTRYINDQMQEYARRLTATLPKALEVCYFVNSASEANELAIRLMKAATGRKEMIVLEAAYHGRYQHID
jgi:4-aminobutyrate aminotransferase-like enzyme